MKYRIHTSHAQIGETGKIMGVEVQPPVNDEVAHNIVRLLLKPEKGGYSSHGYAAESALITRNDEGGTAFVVEQNHYLKEPDVVPRAIGAILDPCGLHEIEYVTPETEAPAQQPEA